MRPDRACPIRTICIQQPERRRRMRQKIIGAKHATVRLALCSLSVQPRYRPETVTGVRATWPGASLIASRQVRNWRSRTIGAAAEHFLYAIPDAAPGTTSGNHRAHFPRHLRTSPGMVLAVRVHEPPLKAEHDSDLIPPYKRGVTGSNPVAPTRFLQIDGSLAASKVSVPFW